MIHTIGDSHCGGVPDKPVSEQAFAQIPGVITHHMGPRLMYSITKGGIKLDNFSINQNDTVVFCFGEIDCRCHVNKFNDYKKTIDELASGYIKELSQLKKLRPDLKISPYNVVPTVRKKKVEENPFYPHLGTDEERKSYVLYMNSKLRELCESNDLIFFDVYDEYCDDEGFLRSDMSDGNVHISDPKYIIEFIRNNL